MERRPLVYLVLRTSEERKLLLYWNQQTAVDSAASSKISHGNLLLCISDAWDI